ncbi:putative G-type lectin S-receptor-like serine/threonine-protein kinase [Cocos nucifera]|uniref:non-specific serine/threonine protein kinase n=1 Tax=Cocos nucifera TaxID=13894 RepID=A0A8K0N509_COCNU|nr:putative G-type lectin S-receptor-like serine/threonine-protein kinase [Cocos nucifera]
MNKITGEYESLTSWKNAEDPAPGVFSDSIDPAGTNEYFLLWNGSQRYWRSGAWNGHYFDLIPPKKPFIELIFINDKQWRGTTCTLYNRSIITRMVMDLTGQIKQFIWLESSQEWLMFWSQPPAQCDVYSLCGPFGICDQGSLPSCRCPHGFQPASPKNWSLKDWSSGCQRKTQLRCREDDQFFMMPNMQLPVNNQPLKVQSHEECIAACLNNCSCTAYAYTYSGGCFLWNGKLQNLRQLYDGDGASITLYLRLAASELMTSGRNNKTVYVVAAVAVVGVLVILVGLAWRYHRKRVTNSMKELGGSLVLFTYDDLRRATRNFSKKLGGGGFGSVYKGLLPDSTAVAVKKLEGLRQGEKQFRTEVSTLGSIQHVNLVRLHGFCSEGAKKLLVYEFMPNGSLDSYLFQNDCVMLNWRTRYEIFLGIARGLAYLHEKCIECIIHCDVKPENILLDAQLCPKVADFGMAKLVGRDFSRKQRSSRNWRKRLFPCMGSE